MLGTTWFWFNTIGFGNWKDIREITELIFVCFVYINLFRFCSSVPVVCVLVWLVFVFDLCHVSISSSVSFPYVVCFVSVIFQFCIVSVLFLFWCCLCYVSVWLMFCVRFDLCVS